MLQRPGYIPANLAKAALTFRWSNAIAVSFGNPDVPPLQLAQAVWPIHYKAKTALALCCLEWVAWRLSEQTDVTDRLQRLEAAWASTRKFDHAS